MALRAGEPTVEFDVAVDGFPEGPTGVFTGAAAGRYVRDVAIVTLRDHNFSIPKSWTVRKVWDGSTEPCRIFRNQSHVSRDAITGVENRVRASRTDSGTTGRIRV